MEVRLTLSFVLFFTLYSSMMLFCLEMIEEYLQEIVENRRDQHYLLDQVSASLLFL